MAGSPPPTEPGRIPYYALLGTSTLGTLSSNIINAPIGLLAPVAAWLCDRFGAKRGHGCTARGHARASLGATRRRALITPAGGA